MVFDFIKRKNKEEEKIVSKKKPVVFGYSDKDYNIASNALVLQKPWITEKANNLTKKGHYVFKVFGGANKPRIKAAVEDFYKVKVEQVNIINVPAKKRRKGRIMGWKKGFKKAVVKLVSGQKIDIGMQ